MRKVKKLSITLVIIIGIALVNYGIYTFIKHPLFKPLLSSVSLLTNPKDLPEASSTPLSSGSTKVLGAQKTSISYDKLYSLINGYRRENRLSALNAHRALEHSAALKLADMQQNKYWTHKDKEGRESWYLFEQVGYHFEKAGENLSFGHTTEWKIFEEWRKSPEHNAQMLELEYEHMGLAADCTSYAQASKKTCVVVLHLAKQKL